MPRAIHSFKTLRAGMPSGATASCIARPAQPARRRPARSARGNRRRLYPRFLALW
jgi:hypothetical protein